MSSLTLSKEEEKRLKGLGFLNNKGTGCLYLYMQRRGICQCTDRKHCALKSEPCGTKMVHGDPLPDPIGIFCHGNRSGRRYPAKI